MSVSPIVIPPAPAEDAALDAIFQAMVVGMTGMDGFFVRPRWQPVVPKQPEQGTDWAAIGVMESRPDAFPYITHLSGDGITDPSADLFERHEELEVLVSFYGPNAKNNLSILRDGLNIVQNLEVLAANQIAFVETQDMRAAPEFTNEQWIRRYDMPLRFRRKVSRIYTVANLLYATVDLFDDSGRVNRVIPVPPDAPQIP